MGDRSVASGKRIWPLVRCWCVKSMRTPDPGWAWGPVVAGAVLWSWPVVCLVVVVQIGLILARLLVEWQRRRTILSLIERASAGTTVVMAETVELPALWVEIGCG